MFEKMKWQTEEHCCVEFEEESESHLALVGEVSGEDDARIFGANRNVAVCATLVEHKRAGGPSAQLFVIRGS